MLLIGTITWSYLLITVFYGNKQSCNVHAWHPSISIKLIVLYIPLGLNLQYSFPIYPSIETIGHKKNMTKRSLIKKLQKSIQVKCYSFIQHNLVQRFILLFIQDNISCNVLYRQLDQTSETFVPCFPCFQRRSSFL